MELAGLEPATSWVRSRRAPSSNHADLQVVTGTIAQSGRSECPPITGDFREFDPRNRASGANASPGCAASVVAQAAMHTRLPADSKSAKGGSSDSYPASRTLLAAPSLTGSARAAVSVKEGW
jgi:hypothetical protein